MKHENFRTSEMRLHFVIFYACMLQAAALALTICHM